MDVQEGRCDVRHEARSWNESKSSQWV
jgi:hypothetical protein